MTGDVGVTRLTQIEAKAAVHRSVLDTGSIMDLLPLELWTLSEVEFLIARVRELEAERQETFLHDCGDVSSQGRCVRTEGHAGLHMSRTETWDDDA